MREYIKGENYWETEVTIECDLCESETNILYDVNGKELCEDCMNRYVDNYIKTHPEEVVDLSRDEILYWLGIEQIETDCGVVRF